MRHLLILLVVGLTLPLWADRARPDKRLDFQKNRIQKGIESGAITEREVQQVQATQERIQDLKDQARSDGEVTLKEKAKLERAQDRASKQIYRVKHK